MNSERSIQLVRQLSKSKPTFDAHLIIDWYDGLIEGIVVNYDLKLSLLLRAQFYFDANYLYSVAESPYSLTLELKNKSAFRVNTNVLDNLIEHSVTHDFLLELQQSEAHQGHWAVGKVWGTRVPWYNLDDD